MYRRPESERAAVLFPRIRGKRADQWFAKSARTKTKSNYVCMPTELVTAFTTVTDIVTDNFLPLALLGITVALGLGYLMKGGRKAR